MSPPKWGPNRRTSPAIQRPSQGQVAPRCDTITVQDNFAGPLDPGADPVDIATNAPSRKVDASLHVGAAQQDASSGFQPFGIDSDPAGHRDRRAICLDIAANAHPAKLDIPGYGGAVDRSPPRASSRSACRPGKSDPSRNRLSIMAECSTEEAAKRQSIRAISRGNPATLKVKYAGHHGAAEPQPLLLQSKVTAAAKDEKAQKSRAHGSRRIVPLRAQAVANSVEVSRPQTRHDLGLGCLERLEIGQAAQYHNGRSGFRSVLAHALGVHWASAADSLVARSCLRHRPIRVDRSDLL